MRTKIQTLLLRAAVASALVLTIAAAGANAQRAEITLSIDEAFFDALLDATFKNFDPPEFSIASSNEQEPNGETGSLAFYGLFGPTASSASGQCGSVRVLRETNGVRTAVRFRDGKVTVPLAFSGNYAPPFIGCVDFGGWADSVVDLEYDSATRRLLGKVRVQSVNLNGTGGIGGSLIAQMIQGSIDRKFNPVEILSLDKVSFGLPIPNTGRLKMTALGVRPEISNNAMNVHILYEFSKE